jgi:hypothetical protein
MITTKRSFLAPAAGLLASGLFAAVTAQADTTTYDSRPAGSTPAYTPAPVGPSINNDKYRQLRETCDREVPLGKANPQACLDAASILVSGDLPDEFREVKEDQRIKIALRLLEKAVDHSDAARGRAFDYYDKIGFLGMSTYADAYRAKELMEIMQKSNYPGESLRKIR